MTTRERILLSVFLLALPVVGCRPLPPTDGASAGARGARLWATTCNRCHNLRPPPQFTPEQWPVLVNHMRTRADLTRSEAAAIAAYLQRVAAEDPEEDGRPSRTDG